MTITTNLTAQDYIDARRLAMRPRKGMLILLYCLVVLYAVALGGSIIHAVAGGGFSTGLLVAIFAPAYFALIYYVMIPRRTRKIFRQQKELHEPIRYDFTEGGVRIESSRGHATTPWSDFRQWKGNSKLILLYHSDAIFNMIPLRAFAHDGDRQEFLAELTIRIGEAEKINPASLT